MKNLSQELKRKRDAEARLRQTDPAKSIIYSGDGSTGAGGGGYVVPADLLNEAAHDALDHAGLTGVVADFTDLGDVPAAYTGAGSKIVAVKADVSGLEFVAAPAAPNGIPQGGTEDQLLAKNSAADYDMKFMDAPAAANGVVAGGAAGEVYAKIDGTDYNCEWIPAPSGGGVPERWYIAGSADEGYDDEFDDASIDGDWIAVDVAGKANSWYEPTGLKGLSMSSPSGKGAMDLSGLLRPLDDFAAPCYIETAVKIQGYTTNYPGAGLIFADGVTWGAGVQVDVTYVGNSNIINLARHANYDTRAAYADIKGHAYAKQDRIYMRLYWSAANTFSTYISPDGVVWFLLHSAVAHTVTPTHFGLAVTSHDNSYYPFGANFAYFRARAGAPGDG